MCGIVGYIGGKEAVGVLENGLTRLEYRGYDSAGVAVMNGQRNQVAARGWQSWKFWSSRSVTKTPIEGHVGIAHTRWATHGVPNETNSHPHRDMSETVFVCHNGIIENYGELRQELQAKGIVFRSQTDSEVLPNLIKLAYDALSDNIEYSIGGKSSSARLAEAVRQSCAQRARNLRHCRDASRTCRKLWSARAGNRRSSIGLGEHENILASDIPAILQITRRVILLDDGEMAVLHARKRFEVFDMDDGKERHKAAALIDWDEAQAEKGDFPQLYVEGSPRAARCHQSPAVALHQPRTHARQAGRLESFPMTFCAACVAFLSRRAAPVVARRINRKISARTFADDRG